MVFYPWEKILDAGLAINDMGTQIAEAGREFGCRLWRTYPDSWTRNDPRGSPARQFWNSICNPPNPPVLPSNPNFSGGQCDFKYNITVEVAVFPSTINCNRPGDPLQTANATVWGPVTFVGLDQPDGNCGGFNRVFCICHGSGAFTRNPDPIQFPIAFGSLGRFESIRTLTVTPQSGGPDNCGDPPPSYPPTPPPNPGDETFNVTFDTDTTNEFTFPLVWNNIEFSIPVTFEFEVGDLNINVDGIDLNFNFNNDWNINPPRRDYLPGNRILPPPNSSDYEEEIQPTDNSGEDEIGIDIAYIVLTLTEIPANAKTQFGVDGPDVYYAGWFEFCTAQFYYVRQPIHWQNNIFIPPKGATGYAYTLYNGFSGIIRTYTLRE